MTEGHLEPGCVWSLMSRERDETSGQYTEVVSLGDVMGVFDAIRGPVITSGDVADETGCSRDSARRKLEQLHEEGHVARRKTAGRVVYWRLDATKPNPVNPDDPFFADRPTFKSGESDISERVDEILYEKSDA